jgi:hypothetical protein
MNSRALEAVEHFVSVELYLISPLRLDHGLRHLRPRGLHTLARGLTESLCRTRPIAAAETEEVITDCFPELERRAVRKLAREHLTHVLSCCGR